MRALRLFSKVVSDGIPRLIFTKYVLKRSRERYRDAWHRFVNFKFKCTLVMISPTVIPNTIAKHGVGFPKSRSIACHCPFVPNVYSCGNVAKTGFATLGIGFPASHSMAFAVNALTLEVVAVTGMATHVVGFPVSFPLSSLLTCAQKFCYISVVTQGVRTLCPGLSLNN